MAFLHNLSVSFYINENVDTVNGYKHRTNSSTQVFCNTSATGVKMRLRVQVLTGGWTDDSKLIHMCNVQPF